MRMQEVEFCGLRISVCVAEDVHADQSAMFFDRLRPYLSERGSPTGQEGPGGSRIALLADPSSSAALVVSRSIHIDAENSGSLDLLQTLRRACAMWLVQSGGLLLHGASVELNGRALALVGPSGAGKTTIARRLRAAGAHVIGDEVVALRASRLFGHPLQRRLGDGVAPARGVELSGIALIAQSAVGAPVSLKQLSAPQGARQLIRRVFMPPAEGPLVAAALESCERLSEAVPVYSLSLTNDERATEAVLSLFRRPSPVVSAAQPALAEVLQ